MSDHDHGQIAIVCTDRGQHKSTRITTYWWEPGPDGEELTGMSRALESFSPPDPTEAAGSLSRTSYTFHCARCGREPVITPDRWRAGVDAARRAGIAEIDLSRIGF